MAPRPILIDTDPGQDDAVALLLALAVPEALELRLISTVAGNVPVAQTTANALRIRDLAGRPEIPVAAGMEAPMVEALETAEFVCGPDGLAGAGLPPPASRAVAGHAVDAMIASLRAAPRPVTVCALGPLTNLAMALRLAPDIAGHIAEIVVMGGAMNLGNMTPAAEFNFYVDPHAASVVLGAGIRTTLFGLHATHQALATHDDIAAIGALGSATGRAVHGMLTRRRPGGLGTTGHPMHDPCVIAWLLWPELFTGRDCHVGIELAGSVRGRSTIDWNGRLKRASNAFVVGGIQAAPLFRRMTEALARLP